MAAPTRNSDAEDSPSALTERLALYQRAGGVVVPVVTTLVAFLVGGLVVLATGRNPLPVYRGSLDGTGLTRITHHPQADNEIPRWVARP